MANNIVCHVCCQQTTKNPNTIMKCTTDVSGTVEHTGILHRTTTISSPKMSPAVEMHLIRKRRLSSKTMKRSLFYFAIWGTLRANTFCDAATTLLVCGIHGTNCPACEEEQRQCMKVRPLKTQSLMSIPVETCPQIDPPSLQVDAGPAAGDDGDDNGRIRNRHLPKKPKEIVVVGSKSFVVEMEVYSETSVWWNHINEQDDGCSNPKGRPESLRMERVDVLVFDDDNYDCEQYHQDLDAALSNVQDPPRGREVRPEIGDEVLVTNLGQRVHVLLQQVLVEGAELKMEADGVDITQSITLSMKKMSLYTLFNEGDLNLIWSRRFHKG